MRPSTLISAVALALVVSSGCSREPRVVPSQAETYTERFVTAGEFGSRWPLTVTSGTLRKYDLGGGLYAIVFGVGGRWYPVNGTASSRAASRGWAPSINHIWAINEDLTVPGGPRVRKSISPLIGAAR